jgi:hypothetical protein
MCINISIWEQCWAFCWTECCELIIDNAQNEQYKVPNSIFRVVSEEWTTVKMEAASSSEMSATTYQSTWHHSPEDIFS